MLHAQVPGRCIRSAEVRTNSGNCARFVRSRGTCVQRRIAADRTGVRKYRTGDAPIHTGCELNASRGDVAGSLHAAQQRAGGNCVDADGWDSLLRDEYVEALEHVNKTAAPAHHPLSLASNVPGETQTRRPVIGTPPKGVETLANLH